MMHVKAAGLTGYAKPFALAAAVVFATAACGSEADAPYKPQPAWSGKKATLPPPPQLPNTPIKSGDAYTVYGASHHLRSLVHAKEVTQNPITITGYIVESNIGSAPECAVHPAGKKDPDNCNAPLPMFVVADGKGEKTGPRIKVIGWARNFAIIYDAMKEYDKAKAGEKPKELVKDDILNKDVPFPLPAVGAKVKVTGRYAFAQRASSELVSDPQYGVILYDKMETLEPAPEKAAFKGK